MPGEGRTPYTLSPCNNREGGKRKEGEKEEREKEKREIGTGPYHARQDPLHLTPKQAWHTIAELLCWDTVQ